jgi:ketosteroid isomerase-like protein
MVGQTVPMLRRVGKAQVWVLAVVLTLTGCSAFSARTSLDVTEAEARDVFQPMQEDAFAAMKSGEIVQFCDEWADDHSFCAQSMSTWIADGAPRLERAPLDVTYNRISPTSYRVRVEGVYDDGRSVTSEIEVVRSVNSDNRQVVIVDPIFWIPRTISG